ncbi:MAG: hypothetical protein HQL36_08620 [Alphaproteobacteria bacterium]|nr:hypothetical protein [Alphaproteobacteria bacterium]MBF0249162.1 hypothetical protein [Alphaproteobacteria bacterium]
MERGKSLTIRSQRFLFAVSVLILIAGGFFAWEVSAESASRPRADANDVDAVGQYDRARWDLIHFSPDIEKASNDQCLMCHQEIMDRRVRQTSVAGLKAEDSLAWYQTLDTYAGEQDTFHRRHLTTPFAQQVMNLKCTFCHLGNDPREEAPQPSGQDAGKFTLRKSVNPEQTCLMCHGRFPFEVMEGLTGPWSEARADMEGDDTPNGCMTCHAETFRTVRHQVNYLNADAIEEAAKTSSDVCYGCHGGRSWYRISYPYPRHPWPDMPADVPDWAKSRPTVSSERFLNNTAK